MYNEQNPQMQQLLMNEAIQPVMPEQNIHDQDQAISKWELDTRKEIEKVELTLRGVEKTPDGYVQVSKPIVNNDGLYSLLAPIKSVGNKITSLTILGDNEIRIDCLAFRKDTARKIVVNRKRWGIDKSNRGTITQLLDTLMNAILNKARNALIAKLRREQVVTKEINANFGDGGKNRRLPNL